MVSAPAQRGRPETVGRSEGDRPLPVLPALGPLFPVGGLRRGSAVAVRDSTSLLLALLAGPSRRGAWCGVVGLPGLGLAAAAEAGVALERLALVPDPGRDWAAVAAALLDAMEVVVVAPRGRVPDADVRRLAARARQRGAVLVPFGPVPWPGAELRLSLAGGVWEGLGDGSGRLRSRRVVVRGDGRGSAARGHELALWLPAPDGQIRAVPALHALPTPPDLAPTPAPTPHLHAVPDPPPPTASTPAELAAAEPPTKPAPTKPAPTKPAPTKPAPTKPAHALPTPPDLAPTPAPTPHLHAVPPPSTASPAAASAAVEVGVLRAPARRSSSPGGPGEPAPTVVTPPIAALWQDVTHRPGARPPVGRRADGPALPERASRPRPADPPVPAGRPAPVGGGHPATPPPTAGPRPAIPADVLARLRPASTLPKPPPKQPPKPPKPPPARSATEG